VCEPKSLFFQMIVHESASLVSHGSTIVPFGRMQGQPPHVLHREKEHAIVDVVKTSKGCLAAARYHSALLF
jgi:hypothetical protein